MLVHSWCNFLIYVGGNSHPEWTALEQHLKHVFNILFRDKQEQLNPALQNNEASEVHFTWCHSTPKHEFNHFICTDLSRVNQLTEMERGHNWPSQVQTVISILRLHLQTNHKLRSLQPTFDLLSITQHWTTECNTGTTYWCQQPHVMTAIGLETLPYCHLAKVNEINFGIIFRVLFFEY